MLHNVAKASNVFHVREAVVVRTFSAMSDV